MDELERKLKAYYEHNSDYVPCDGFAGRLMALEARTPAVPKRRRRYVLPVAAAIAAALALGSAWAWLHAAGPDRTPDPEYPQTAQTVLKDAPSRPAPMDERSPDPQPVEEHLSGKPVSPAMPEPEADDRSVPQFTAPVITGDPTPADDPAPADPAEPAPPASEDAPLIPPEEDPPAVKPPEEDPPAVKPPEEKPTEDDPPPVKPPEDPIPGDDTPDANGPQIVRLEDHDIDASYLMEDGRQTLALRCLSTGASVELDVTGWQEELDETPALPPPEETPAQAASTYTGRSSIVDVVFDKNIVFYLILEEDGTVLVKLDVTEA